MWFKSVYRIHLPASLGVFCYIWDKIPPDITYSALTSDEHDEHPVYTAETIKKAIKKGIDPSGSLLDSTMPRWHMSDKDVDDVVEYLKKLDN
ncbi:cytochrome c [Methanohalobium sp.]|uniref:c-type cytochrome n=1 Tax=Methanohalobium sp. TaxID=2837493 RepID=UPI0025E2458D|nr:cytochrome c [Methanohalobium sp.]